MDLFDAFTLINCGFLCTSKSIGETALKKADVHFDVTEDQKNQLRTLAMMSGCGTLKEYILQQTIHNSREKQFSEFMQAMTESIMEVQKQLFVLYKVNVTVLLELTKMPQFTLKVAAESKELVQKTIDIYKDQAEKAYPTEKKEEKIL